VSSASKAASGRGGFFAIDRRAWARVCALGLNAAIAYLVLARGSGGDNRTTSWSVHATEERTGIARNRARMAIEALLKGGLVRRDKGGQHPRYFIMPAHEVPGCTGYPPVAMTKEERALHAQLASGDGWVSEKSGGEGRRASPRTIARRLVEKGLAEAVGDNYFKAIVYDAEAAARPDWVWLPNTIVDGAAEETPAIERIRQSQNIATLRLFVDLYHAHLLEHDGGVHWRKLCQQCERHKIGEWGAYNIWGFTPSNKIS
jgi:hypothetical protein